MLSCVSRWSSSVSVHSSHSGWSTSLWPDMMSNRSLVTYGTGGQSIILLLPERCCPCVTNCVVLDVSIFSTFNLWLRFSMVPPSEASPMSVKLLALSVDITLQHRANLRSVTWPDLKLYLTRPAWNELWTERVSSSTWQEGCTSARRHPAYSPKMSPVNDDPLIFGSLNTLAWHLKAINQRQSYMDDITSGGRLASLLSVCLLGVTVTRGAWQEDNVKISHTII